MKKREKSLRNDSSLTNAAKQIEMYFNLPEGCIRIIKPNGRKMRCDATVKSLREEWTESNNLIQ